MNRKTKSFLISFLLLFAVLLGVYAFNTPTAKANEISANNENLLVNKIDVIMTEPMHGEYYDGNFTSFEPEKYSVVLTQIKYSDEEQYALSSKTPIFDTATPYQAGMYYFFFFKVEMVDSSVLAEGAEIYVNGKLAQSDLADGYYVTFETLFPITVIEGEAFADDGFTIPMTHVKRGGTFYVKANDKKDDLSFNSWVIEGSPRETGDVQYHLLRIRQGDELLTVTATYSKKHKITVVGGTAGAKEAVVGRTLKLNLGWVPDDAVFSHWTINGEILELVDNGKRFVMLDEDVYIEAIYHYHVYDGSFKYDENKHWSECADGEDCLNLEHSKKNKGEHSFDHDCDATCNDGCGYERVISHAFEKTWTIDANFHWHACAVEGCSETDSKAPHEIENGVCSGCKHVFEVVIKGITPTFGITVSEYYDYATQFTVNGIFDPDNFGSFGILTLKEGGLNDSKKQPITDNSTVITDGTYYFYLDLEIKSGYKFVGSETFVITCENAISVEYLSYYGGLIIYAKYEVRHTCVNDDLNDHDCDICSEKISDCVDTEPKDHVCDICGVANMGTHEPAEGTHTCDYCGETLSSCTDTEPKDHVCDICSEKISDCVDTEPKDHVCDICGSTLSSHKDLDKDGLCDHCESEMSPSSSESEPETETESIAKESNSTTLDSSSVDTDVVGCMGAIADSGLAIFAIAGFGVITLLRKRR